MSMYCIDTGSGSPPFVFVHGFACAHGDWQAQIDHFGGRHRVLACDLRGHGLTPGEPDECSIETFGADVAALLEAKDLRDTILVGHSMGCRVVLQAFLNAPHRVGALALVDGSYQGAGLTAQEAERATRTLIQTEGYSNFARRLFSDMFLAPSAQANAIVQRALELPEAIGAALFPRLARWDAAHTQAALARVNVPVLVIQCTYLSPERNRVALEAGQSSPWLDLVRRVAPGARIEIITGAGHFPQLEAPARINTLLAALAGR